MSRGPSTSSRDVEAVVRVLGEYRHGLSRKDLREVLSVVHRKMGDSVVRVAVENARAAGWPLIHDGERYRLAASRDEYDAWEARELNPRINTLLAERAAMRARAEATWTDQMRLISA